ncbi:hypothetical protein K443DRAFT_12061 [Laccaria amethystina LaAM-08-1]|uniref:Unplaced genomic scaffold K443scaffold_255, whole genome shotgun sequence n=1 Tax=Laccaria amethystina LaAM-08-1 TaxID=1095629 RepID=A0A0C9WJD3_9AGAR|nr:hypothetical protein K443DRAFT_12061 [Laccaria amethystina LaAM-08-1]
MAGWRADLYAKLLKIGQLAVAVAVDTFPKLDVLMNYAMPLTSRTLGGPPNASQSWVPRAPDLPQIAKLCKQYFRWCTCDTISKKFHTRIWDGICIRRLMEPVDEYEVLRQHIEDGVVFDNPPGMCSFLRITNARAGRLLARGLYTPPHVLIRIMHTSFSSHFDWKSTQQWLTQRHSALSKLISAEPLKAVLSAEQC